MSVKIGKRSHRQGVARIDGVDDLNAFLGQLPNRQFYFTHSNMAITPLDISADHLLVRCIKHVNPLPHDMIS